MVKRRNLGFGFKDEILKVSSKIGNFKQDGKDSEWKDLLIPNYDPEEIKDFKGNWGPTFFICITLILFFTLFLRLFHLQIVKGENNKNLADGNRIKIKLIHAPRGIIYDRYGKVLAANSPAFRLFSDKDNKAKLISREEALELEVKNDPSVSVLEIDNLRSYPLADILAHVVGYIGEVSDMQLKSDLYKNYRLGDRVGKSGIEAQYENILKGRDGGEIIEVDSSGKQLRTLRKEAPVSGQNIYLTIDASLQEKLSTLLKDELTKLKLCCASAVVSDPASGQILALVSFPSFDPNVFTSKVNDAAISDIFNNPDSPILNRVISGTYPPGSTYKIISSLAALSSGKITPQTTFIDNGVLYIETFKFTNWYFNQYGKTEGAVNLVKAIKRSNDTFFYEVGKILGEEPFIDWSKKLFLGSKLGIDLPNEEEGLVPDDEWKRETFNLPWYPGDTLHMAIGQGFVLTTPLQVHGALSFIAANGILYKPQLVDKIVKGRDSVISKFEPAILAKDLIDENKISVIKQGLSEVTKDGGTAWPFLNFPIDTSGKTGTAEFGDPKDRTHAWYTAYAPTSEPKVAITVLVEAGGEGSSVAAPVAREFFRWYFSEDKNKLIKDKNVPASDSAKTLGE